MLSHFACDDCDASTPSQLHILDPSDPCDLFCLHAVYFDIIQAALDDFRDMWNHHVIRGKRTEDGHGGGMPIDLFHDPVGSASLRDRDDEQFNADPSEYGVDDPHKADTAELEEISAKLEDPLARWPSLQQLRCAFFDAYPLASYSNGVEAYLCFKVVSLELLLFQEHTNSGGDWRTFVVEETPYHESAALDIRRRLAELAMQ